MEHKEPPIYVTKPHLPDLEKVYPYIQRIWENGVLTNSGPFHQELESKLESTLDISHLRLCNNGTSAIMAALFTANLSGEVITTPYTFAATTHSIKLCGLTPVFADVEGDSFGLCPMAVERAITQQTSAILAVHVYGRPCNVEALKDIAEKYNLKLIYDASHAFGCEYQGRSLLSYGDYSTLSFHATKVFNTFEGGAVVSSNKECADRINLIKNFGISGEDMIPYLGFNGKMNEFSAAIGMLQLDEISLILSKRKQVAEWYDEELIGLEVVSVPKPIDGHVSNYSYYPIIMCGEAEGVRDRVVSFMCDKGVHPRKYFYPLMSNICQYKDLDSALKDRLPVANKLSNNVLCLPIYPSLTRPEVKRVCEALKGALNQK
ncbi:DegT/DnrJ/EryC1/StrS family aminotransferase [Rubritalea marina]|uniref:DegT/DnrJ/EryC1/StrS family aminotransferase n=1 Tax=Rubritalea marina TaxID=361055 RepID=UPI00037A9809|nr:DegT/DnrJ/EryC1/StrS family aminotransferase [Rubritalea marina]